MNHKITFQELIDAIADQSGKSKKFAHDFTKDLVSIIKESLEKDGSINIAGFGKFELQKMDEREGYNPQTEEKITIPAHNKIEFTPYKDLRELVNAPYSHLEPEIIEESEEPISEDGDEDLKDSAGTPDSSEEAESEKKKAPWQEDMESEIEVDKEDPFGLNAGRKERAPFSFDEESEDEDKESDNEDVVEFTPGLKPESEEETEESSESEQPSMVKSDSDEEEPEIEDKDETEIEDLHEDQKTGPPVSDTGEGPQVSNEESKAEEPVRETEEVEKEKSGPKSKSTISFKSRRHRRRDSEGGNTFWIIAAAFIILLLAIGAWYFMGSQQGVPADSADSQMVQGETAGREQQEQEQESEQGEESQQNQQATADQTTKPEADAGARPEPDTQQQSAADRQTAQTGDPDPPVETITVAAGQTLWGLADNEYNNPYLWPWIYDTNKPEIENPNIIYIGQSLDIPQRRGSNNELSASDSLQVALGYVETYLWYKENELENAKFYLYAAKQYHNRVFEYTNANIDEADLTFANRAQ